MILDGGARAFNAIGRSKYDWLIYGLGFETRSVKIASIVDGSCKIVALKMPERRIHSYTKNVSFATTRKHIIPPTFQSFLSDLLPTVFQRSKKPLNICFDISSVNRIMLAETIAELARLCRSMDKIDIVYCPASFQEPDWQFPQIERIGPINATLSSIESDLNKPLCLVLGAGFEAGISMGLVSQLEPRVSYCFWGTGIDSRFDRAVRRANFEFEFGGFNTKPIPYNIRDPKGAFIQLESATYGFTKGFRVIVIPMGPKIFTMLSTLLGMLYVGQIAVWRVQHSRVDPPDAMPSDFCIWTQLNTSMLIEFAQQERQLMSFNVEEVA
jgi:hypothetical protein